MKKLWLNTSNVTFTVTKEAAKKLDQNGKERFDRETGEVLYAVELMALDANEGGSIITVTVAGEPQKMTVGQAVTTVELQALPWVQGNRNGVAYRAKAVKPIAAAKAAA